MRFVVVLSEKYRKANLNWYARGSRRARREEDARVSPALQLVPYFCPSLAMRSGGLLSYACFCHIFHSRMPFFYCTYFTWVNISAVCKKCKSFLEDYFQQMPRKMCFKSVLNQPCWSSLRLKLSLLLISRLWNKQSSKCWTLCERPHTLR